MWKSLTRESLKWWPTRCVCVYNEMPGCKYTAVAATTRAQETWTRLRIHVRNNNSNNNISVFFLAAAFVINRSAVTVARSRRQRHCIATIFKCLVVYISLRTRRIVCTYLNHSIPHQTDVRARTYTRVM